MTTPSQSSVRPADEETVQALADALDEHRWESHGLSYGTPDRCSCGQETRPERGDDDVTDRRSRAMCQHVARAVVASEQWQRLVRERDEARAAVARISTMEHRYGGDCPDPSQPDARDPLCPACLALTSLSGGAGEGA